ncbi:hypothetical protein JOC78_001649 [Bacillus ectoiniformans]|nr:hypothetical protein [Bacillus ectoiniformans]
MIYLQFETAFRSEADGESPLEWSNSPLETQKPPLDSL